MLAVRIALLFSLFALLIVGTLTVLFEEAGLAVGVCLCCWLGKGAPFDRQDIEALLVLGAIGGILLSLFLSVPFRDMAGSFY